MTQSGSEGELSGPSSPTAALLGDLASRAQARGVQMLLAAFEHVLRQQAWARDKLRMHAGRTVRIGVDVTPLPGLPTPQLLATITEGGLLQPADPLAEPSATLLLEPSPDAFVTMLREGPKGLSRHLRIDGDVMLVGTLGELAQHLRWDAEEDLSKLVGDVAAHRIAQFARGGVQGLADLGQRAQTAAAQFFGSGQPPLLARRQAQHLREGIEELDQRLQALEGRAARLCASRP